MDVDARIRVDRSLPGSRGGGVDKTNAGDVDERDLGGETFRPWCRTSFREGIKDRQEFGMDFRVLVCLTWF